MMDILKEIYDYYQAELPPPSRIVCGAKYFAVENSLGNVGLAANLEEHKAVDLSELKTPHFGNYHQRVAVNAWINAYVNHLNSYLGEKDIFDQINFRAYRNIVMVGFFESLAAKFHRENIPLTIFDLNKQSPSVAPLKSQYEAIHIADVVIVSSTSLANQTLSKIIFAKGVRTKIMMLGPSTPLCPQLMKITGANILFGSTVTDKNKLSEIVSNGGGTKQFLPYLKKVYFQSTL